MEPPPKKPMQVRFSPFMIEEYGQRGLDYAPYDRIENAGEYELTSEEAAEVKSDAAYQGNIGGGGLD